jgi:hypothetical protein
MGSRSSPTLRIKLANAKQADIKRPSFSWFLTTQTESTRSNVWAKIGSEHTSDIVFNPLQNIEHLILRYHYGIGIQYR